MQQALGDASGRVVIIVDAQPLRAAAMLGLLRDWSALRRVSLASLQPSELTAQGQAVALVVLNLGGGSLAEVEGAGALQRALQASAVAPVAVISDREEPEEVVAALRAGARGYIPTSTAPDVALNALSYLLEGGSFFPPGALLEGRRPRGERWDAASLPRNGAKLRRRPAQALLDEQRLRAA